MPNITLNTATDLPPELSTLAARLRNPRALMRSIGRAGEECLQGHFNQRNKERPKSGLKRQNWWASVRDATHLTAYDDTTATITIQNDQFPLRLYGGTVRPREKKYMAIPLVNAAVGKYPRTMSGLFFLRLKSKGAADSDEAPAYLAKKTGKKTKKLTLRHKTKGAADSDEAPAYLAKETGKKPKSSLSTTALSRKPRTIPTPAPSPIRPSSEPNSPPPPKNTSKPNHSIQHPVCVPQSRVHQSSVQPESRVLQSHVQPTPTTNQSRPVSPVPACPAGRHGRNHKSQHHT